VRKIVDAMDELAPFRDQRDPNAGTPEIDRYDLPFRHVLAHPLLDTMTI
jgi:hypothetical protein